MHIDMSPHPLEEITAFRNGFFVRNRQTVVKRTFSTPLSMILEHLRILSTVRMEPTNIYKTAAELFSGAFPGEWKKAPAVEKKGQTLV